MYLLSLLILELVSLQLQVKRLWGNLLLLSLFPHPVTQGVTDDDGQQISQELQLQCSQMFKSNKYASYSSFFLYLFFVCLAVAPEKQSIKYTTVWLLAPNC